MSDEIPIPAVPAPAIEEAEAIERLRAVHDYGLAELATALGKSDSTISEILTLNKLPAEVKDDCRNDPKAMRSILVLIARQKTAEKMTALYTKYKESGLTVGKSGRRLHPRRSRSRWQLLTSSPGRRNSTPWSLLT